MKDKIMTPIEPVWRHTVKLQEVSRGHSTEIFFREGLNNSQSWNEGGRSNAKTTENDGNRLPL